MTGSRGKRPDIASWNYAFSWHFDAGWAGEGGGIVIDPLLYIEIGKEKKSSKKLAEGGLPWTKKAKTYTVVAMFPESLAFGSFLLPVASGLGNLASAVVAGCLLQCSVYKWNCAIVMVVVALSEKCCLKCCLVTALQSIWSKYRATGANKLPGGQTAQLSVQILTAWVDDDGTIRRLIRQIWQPYHFAYIPILYTIHHTAPFAHNTSQ